MVQASHNGTWFEFNIREIRAKKVDVSTKINTKTISTTNLITSRLEIASPASDSEFSAAYEIETDGRASATLFLNTYRGTKRVQRIAVTSWSG